MKTHTESLVIDGDKVSTALSIEGTNIGGFMGLPASGKPFRLSPRYFWTQFKDRHIACERRIYHFTGMLTQIGVLKTKPV